MMASGDPADTTPRVMAERIAQFASETTDARQADVYAHMAAAWALLDVADAIREAASNRKGARPEGPKAPIGACSTCGHWSDTHMDKGTGPCRTPRCHCSAFTRVDME